jgi:membrane-associated protease RseP (regulator of RpoE activity)
MKFRGMWLPLVAALVLPGTLRAQEDECPCRERPGMIGVVFDMEGREGGVRIVEVRRGSPADRAGVREGDVVVRLNGDDATASMNALPGRLQAGDTVRLRLRGGEGEREVVVVAEPRPSTGFSMIRPGGGENLIIINGDSVRMPMEALTFRIDSLRMPMEALTFRIDSLRTRLMDLHGGNFTIEVDSLVTMFDGADSVFIHRLPNMPPMRLREGVVVEGGIPFGPEGRPFFMELGRRSAAGAELAEMNEGLSRYFGGQREGALVIEVSPESPAARAGLQAGDVIVRAGGQDVEDPADVREALNRAEAGQVALEVVRQGRRQALSLEWTGGDRLFHREVLPGREPVRGREPARTRERVRVRTRP